MNTLSDVAAWLETKSGPDAAEAAKIIRDRLATLTEADQKTFALVELRKLEATYAEVHAVTERCRVRGMELQRKVEAAEKRLGILTALESHPTTAKP